VGVARTAPQSGLRLTEDSLVEWALFGCLRADVHAWQNLWSSVASLEAGEQRNAECGIVRMRNHSLGHALFTLNASTSQFVCLEKFEKNNRYGSSARLPRLTALFACE